MNLFGAALALLPLATASLNPRQAAGVEIVDTNPVGPGCPADTRRVAPSNSTTDAAVSFDRFESVLGEGTPDAERDVHCQIFVTLRFPQGCTATTLETTYRGKADVTAPATAVLAPSYRLTGGDLEVGEIGGTFIEGAEDFDRTDEVVARVEAEGDGDELRFVVRSRAFIQVTGEEAGGEGSVSFDDISVSIKSSESC